MEKTENSFSKKNRSIPSSRYSKNTSVIFNFFDDIEKGMIEIDIKGYIKKINSKAAFLLGARQQETIHQIIWAYPWQFYKKGRLKIPRTKNPIFLGVKKKLGHTHYIHI
jgi:transcriptional regulator with PAS, ATPase and Fis domain